MDKQFPDGFDCDGCYLNGVSTWAGDHTELFKGSDNPGVDATVSAVEGITDLDINYWAMVNLEGFRDLVDAVGGVDPDRPRPDPGRPAAPTSSSATSSPAPASSTAWRRCGSPGPARAPTTTRGWRARSAS